MVCRRMNIEDMLPNDAKDAIKKLHQRLLRLEGEKYDLEKRHDRQDYDVIFKFETHTHKFIFS